MAVAMWAVQTTAEAPYGLASSTLRDRLPGAIARVDAHAQPQLQTSRDEKVILGVVNTPERTPFAPRFKHLEQGAHRITIARPPPGKN